MRYVSMSCFVQWLRYSEVRYYTNYVIYYDSPVYSADLPFSIDNYPNLAYVL